MTRAVLRQTVWIDVTDFLKWKGNFTGFQHIQYNMARQYIEDGRNVRFFVYNEGDRAFQAVSFDPDKVAADGIRNQQTPAMSVSSRQRLKGIAKRYIPVSVKAVLKQFAPVNSTHTSEAAVPVSNPFNANDTVLVLGGIWHGTFADDIVTAKKDKRFTFVHIVHDMIPVRCPQYVVEDLPAVFAAYKEKIFQASDGLIINSKSSRRDALEFMEERGITPPKSVVFRIADEPIADKKGIKPESVDTQPFIFSIGTIEGRKNHALLYYAYKEAARRGVDLPKLIIAGRKGWLVNDLLYVLEHDADIKGKIQILYDVSNAERAWLYANCLFTVWPSFYEGWGMPVAESVAYGKLCLSSDSSSMPEIAGNLNEYFSPYSPEQCLDLIITYMDKKKRLTREAMIQSQYQPTTWKQMYNQISSFIDDLTTKN